MPRPRSEASRAATRLRHLASLNGPAAGSPRRRLAGFLGDPGLPAFAACQGLGLFRLIADEAIRALHGEVVPRKRLNCRPYAFQELYHPESTYLEKAPTAQFTRIDAADWLFSGPLTRITSVPECAVSSVGFLWGPATVSRSCGVSVGLVEAPEWTDRPRMEHQVPRLPQADDRLPGNPASPGAACPPDVIPRLTPNRRSRAVRVLRRVRCPYQSFRWAAHVLAWS